MKAEKEYAIQKFPELYNCSGNTLHTPMLSMKVYINRLYGTMSKLLKFTKIQPP